MNFKELPSIITERIVRKKVVRNGEIKRIKQSNRPGFVLQNGKEVKRTASDAVKLGKTQKRASIKRRAKSGLSDTKKHKSLKRRTW